MSVKYWLYISALLLNFFPVNRADAALERLPVPAPEAAQWARWIVPLPRELRISERIRVSPAQVTVIAPTRQSQESVRAVEELRRALRLTAQSAAPAEAEFTISLELGGPDAEALKLLKNPDQAYRIIPTADNRGLRLVARAPRGLYYAAKTLQQLLRANRGNATLEIPLCEVRDWPELEDRGLWGVDAFMQLEWLADRKLNYVEQITALAVDPLTKKGRAKPKPGHETLLELGPRLGIEFVPVILHLEQLESKGVFEAFPNLRGKNAGKPGAICYSQPEFAGVLADWLVDLAQLPHVKEVDVWLAENLSGKGGCKCAQCAREDRNVLELETVLRAWRLAKERAVDFGLRVLTSEETYPSHKALFPKIPREVKLWYYHSLLTYTAMEKPMITGETMKLADAGHWVGVCPSLVAHVGFSEPFSSAQFVHYRVSEFVKRNMQGIIGYPSPRVLYARFNVEAMAEWTWNPNGRAPREFAVAWAVREGSRHPEKFADWAEVHGAVAWDVYGSDWPAGEQRKVPGPVADLLRKGALPKLGEVKWGLYPSPWGDFKIPAQLEAGVKSARQSVALAREIGLPEFLQESLVVQGYMDALKALHELKQMMEPTGIEPGKRLAARQQFEAYKGALEQSLNALMAWEQTVAEPGSAQRLVEKPVNKLRDMIAQMDSVAESARLK